MTKHYVFMDGMRGIAALAIVLLHASQVFKISYTTHAYLAVDFFFCLSGFVMGHAYEKSLSEGRLSSRQFLIKRLIRLYPMILIGAVFGGVVIVASFMLRGEPGIGEVGVMVAGGLTLLPLGILIGKEAFALNNPLWSLSFEVVANALYGIWPKGRKSAVTDFGLLFVFAVAVVALIWHFGWLAPIGFNDLESYLGGFVRVAYPFFAGVLIHRYAIADRLPRMHFLLPLLLLSGVMMLPFWQISVVYDSVAMIVIVPLVVLMSEKVAVGRSAAFWTFLGRLSYPIYIMHMPVLRVMSYGQVLTGNALPAGVFLVVSMLATGVAAWIVLILFDEPVRAWLARRHRRADEAERA